MKDEKMQKKNNVVLDASAILALINEEKGAKKIEMLLGRIVMSTVNIAEVASNLSDFLENKEDIKLSIEPFLNMIIPFDTEQAYIASELKRKTKRKGLSLGDRACIALGIHLKLPVYTADKIWAELDLDDMEINIIR